MKAPAPLKESPEYREGYEAARNMKSFQGSCPYTYQRSGCLAAGDHNRFEREFRPKMDAWFAGWKAWLDEHNLGFTFQPKRKGKRQRP